MTRQCDLNDNALLPRRSRPNPAVRQICRRGPQHAGSPVPTPSVRAFQSNGNILRVARRIRLPSSAITLG